MTIIAHQERPLPALLAELLPQRAAVRTVPPLAGVFGGATLLHEPDLGLFVLVGIDPERQGALGSSKRFDMIARNVERVRDSLANHLESVTGLRPSPWMPAVAVAPQLSRSGLPTDREAQRLIVADDLTAPAALRARLALIGAVAGRPRPTDHDLLELHRALDEPVLPAPGDTARMHRILAAARRPDQLTAAMLSPVPARHVRLTGPAGSGRTDDLLRIAVQRAARGEHVLLTCRHSVLLAELVRLLTAVPDEDVDPTTLTLATAGDIMADPGGALGPDTFDTVLVDEGEVYPGEAVDAIRSRCRRETEWFVSADPGRQPARTGAVNSWPHPLIHRNPAPLIGLVGEAVRQLAPDATAGVAFALAHAQLIESTGRRNLPRVVRIAAELNTSTDGRIEFLRTIIGAEHAAADDGSLAVLVSRGSRSGAEAAWVRRALNELELPFVDQTEPGRHHLVAPADHVRLLTMQQASGVEADRVVVVGLGWLGDPRRGDGDLGDGPDAQRAIGHIAVTRSRRGLVIAHIPSPNMPAGYVDFVEQVVTALRG